MTLRMKNDWDEALEEARNAAIERGEIKPRGPLVPGPGYDYGRVIEIPMSEILDEDTEPPK